MVVDRNSQYHRWRRRFEVPVIIAALLVVPVILVEQAEPAGWLAIAAPAVNWAIWLVFAAELATLTRFTVLGEHFRRHWLDIFIVVTSFPLLGTWLAGTRLLRLVRLGRVLRLVAIAARGGVGIRRVFKAGGVGYLLAASVLIALVAGGLFALLEPTAGTIIDGIWWAIVTLTTVGYGDLYPETLGGRSAAVVLMIVGISFVAILTGSIASYLTSSTAEGQSHEDDVLAALSRIEARLESLESRIEDAPSPDR